LLQETWRGAGAATTEDGFVLLAGGPGGAGGGTVDPGGGVGILLSPRAVAAWREADEWVVRFGDRVIAARLALRDGRRRPLHLYLVSSYAPVDTAPAAERRRHLYYLQQCVDMCRSHELLLIGTDANVRLGVSSDGGGGVRRTVGRFGVSCANDSADHKRAAARVHDFLAANGLCAAGTFYDGAGTHWTRESNGRAGAGASSDAGEGAGAATLPLPLPLLLPRVQIDHVFVRRAQLRRRFRRVWCPGNDCLESDHRRVRVKLQRDVHARPRKRSAPAPRDWTVLLDRASQEYSSFSASLNSLVGRVNVAEMEVEGSLGRLYSAVHEAMRTLPEKTLVAKKTWLRDSAELVLPAAAARAAASAAARRCRAAAMRREPGSERALRAARAEKKRATSVYAAAVREAKRVWERRICASLSGVGELSLDKGHTAAAWEAVRDLASGASTVRNLPEFRLKDNDTGRVCDSAADTARIFSAHLHGRHSVAVPYNGAAIDSLPQRACEWALDVPPTRGELIAAAGKVRNGASTGFHKVPPVVMKCLLRCDAAAAVLVDLVGRYWTSSDPPDEPAVDGVAHGPRRGRGECRVHYTEFDFAKLAALPKKGGDATAPASWRTIAVLDAIGSLVSGVIAARLRAWLADKLPESACGFRPGRGVTDCCWNIVELLSLRRRAGHTTWAAFCDVMAAFDRVGRKHLFRALEVLGLPPRFVAVVRDLHKNATFKFRVGTRWYEVRNRAGCRAGDRAGPDLFLVVMLAIFEYVKWPEGGAPVFVSSKHWGADGGDDGADDMDVESREGSYADDVTLLFDGREALALGMAAFQRAVHDIAGLSLHFASEPAAVKDCKTVCMVFPPPGTAYTALDTSPLAFDVGGGLTGYVGFVEHAKYLGVVLHWDLGSEQAVSARIAAAAASMSALRKVLRDEDLSASTKGVIMKSTVLPILLFGSEVWVMTVDIMRRVSAFWHSCCRRALGVGLLHMRSAGMHMRTVRARLAVKEIGDYYDHRVFTWLGRMLLMGRWRLPRQLLMARAMQKVGGRRGGGTGGGASDGVGGGGAGGGGDDGGGEDIQQQSGGIGSVSGGRIGGGGGDDGDSDSAGHVGGGSYDDSLEEAGSGDHRPGGRRFKAEYAASARSKCALTGVLIAQGAVRVLRDRLPTVPGGVGIPVTWSLAGLTYALSRDESGAMRRAVDRGIDGLGLLRPADQLAVKLATSEQLVREVHAARALPAITPPAPDALAWTCSRCGKVYVKMQCALQHANNADCKPKRVRRVVPAVEEAPPPDTGKKRRGTWLARTLRRLRVASGVRSGCHQWSCHDECARCAPHPSCIAPRHDPCDSCLLLESQRLLHEASDVWDTVVYGPDEAGEDEGEGDVHGEGGTGDGGERRARRQRRRRGQRYKHQHVAAAEPWHDPRPAWADVRLRQFLAEGRGRGGRFRAAVKRLLDCSLGRMDAAIDDLLRAWYKDRVKGLLGIVKATCHVLEGGRRHIGKARALLRVILQNSEGSLQAQCRRRSLVRTALRTMGRG